MRAGPIVSLILSILVGIAAVIFGRGWLNSEAEAARPETSAIAETVTPVALTEIYVAGAAISRGDEISVDSLRLVEWPTEYVPLGAITDPADFINPDGSLPFSLGVIVPGEPVLLNKISSQTVRDTLAQVIEPGYRAVSVEVDDATGVAGFILPDHRVDVNAFREVEDADRNRVQRGELLLSDIRVLAVDQTFAEGQNGAQLAQTVTLQVTPDQANRLGVAIQSGTIGLALRRYDEVAAAPKPIAPNRPASVRSAPATQTQPAFATIRMIAGEEEDTVKAPIAQPDAQTGN